MKPIAYKFVKWDVPALDTLRDSKVYQLRERLNQGLRLSREEKNWLTKQVITNSSFRRSVPLMGYCFDFSDVLKRFFVKQYNQINEYYAMDKTALRYCLYGRIQEIHEV